MVLWLRENIKSVAEVDTFIDLILTSETDSQKLCIITCLQSIVRAYCPLIYQFEEEDDCSMLLLKVKKVWANVELDKKLATKVRDVQKSLGWLKTVKKSYGAADITAYETVKQIVNTGKFKVSNQDNISVRITIERCEEDLDFEKLKELLGQITLRTGIREDERNNIVSDFIKIFDGLTRLRDNLKVLHNNGSLLFSKSTFEFSKQSNNFNTCITFGLSVKQLFGAKSIPIEKHISDICLFLENCIEEWCNYVQEKRDIYDSLNFYTNSQLLTLRKELSEFLKTRKPSDPLINLCSIINFSCKRTDISNAVSDISKEIEIERKEECSPVYLENESNSSERFSREGTLFSNKDELYECLIESFPEEIVQKAINKFGNRDFNDIFDEAFLFCTNPEDDKNSSDSEPDDEGSNMNFLENAPSLEHNLEDYSKNEDELCERKSLTFKMKNLWEKFLTNVEYNKDYMSFDHLGKILNRLINSPNFHFQFPTCLTVGRPNLVVCNMDKTWPTILHLFLNQKDSSLPSLSQILLCSEKTTPEEIELIYRRAAAFCNQFYMIVNSHNLSFEASEMAEKIFDSLQSKGKTGKHSFTNNSYRHVNILQEK